MRPVGIASGAGPPFPRSRGIQRRFLILAAEAFASKYDVRLESFRRISRREMGTRDPVMPGKLIFIEEAPGVS